MRNLFICLVLALPLSARAQVNAPTYQGQNRVNAGAFQNDSLLGCVPFHLDSSVTPVLIASGAGFVERLCAFSDVGGSGFAAALDSASVSGMSVVSSIPAGKAILEPVQSLNLATAVNSQNAGCATIGDAPGQFANGLVVAASTNTIQIVGCYRLAAGTNPGP